MSTLLFKAGPNAGKRFPLEPGDKIIGRHSDCEIFIPDMRVSRQHAKIRYSKEAWIVEDLGSNNGTFVNGEKVSHKQLSNGDEIRIANTVIVANFKPTQSPTRIQRPLDTQVTVVDHESTHLVPASKDSSEIAFEKAMLAEGLIAAKNKSLLERKVVALSGLMESAARSHNILVLKKELISRVLELFLNSASVSLFESDSKTHDFQVKLQKHRDHNETSDIKVAAAVFRALEKGSQGVLLSSVEAHKNKPPMGRNMAAALRFQDANFGVLYVEGKDLRFTQEDVDLLASISAHAAMAMHSRRARKELRDKERLERDLRVARQIQRSLLPAHLPLNQNIECAVHYEPAFQIGGDFYDFIWLDEKRLAIVIGDVAGKAISAALYMASLTSQLRSQSGIYKSPARILRKVNRAMVDLAQDAMFATLLYFVLDLETMMIRFTNSGHMTPLLRRGENVFPLTTDVAHVSPIGIDSDIEFGEANVQLMAGDTLILTTDGVHEARDHTGEDFGEERLKTAILSSPQQSQGLLENVLRSIDDHVGGKEQSDDITIFAMKIADIVKPAKSSQSKEKDPETTEYSSRQ